MGISRAPFRDPVKVRLRAIAKGRSMAKMTGVAMASKELRAAPELNPRRLRVLKGRPRQSVPIAWSVGLRQARLRVRLALERLQLKRILLLDARVIDKNGLQSPFERRRTRT
jgi:hypothetical protein